MELGLCMVVKNEESALVRNLLPIYTYFDDISIVDTGSSDKTLDVLNKMGITPTLWQPDPRDVDINMRYWEPYARNLSISKCKSDWVLVLDADEQISSDDIIKIKNSDLTKNGYFLPWENYVGRNAYLDYKLCLFRNNLGIEYDHILHSNTQLSFRKNNMKAGHLQEITIKHLQESRPIRKSRVELLEKLFQMYPENSRYGWFLGYTSYVNGDIISALKALKSTVSSRTLDFPAECFYSHLVLAKIYSEKGQHQKASEQLVQALSFYDEHSNDFEIKINIRAYNWAQESLQMISQKKSSLPSIYFPY